MKSIIKANRQKKKYTPFRVCEVVYLSLPNDSDKRISKDSGNCSTWRKSNDIFKDKNDGLNAQTDRPTSKLTSSAEDLSSGSLLNIWRIKSLAEFEIPSQNGGVNSKWPARIASNNSSGRGREGVVTHAVSNVREQRFCFGFAFKEKFGARKRAVARTHAITRKRTHTDKHTHK